MRAVPKGTILMSFKLTVGRLAVAGCDLYTNEAIVSIVPTSAICGPYLRHFLGKMDFAGSTDQAVKGATLNKGKLASLDVVLPPIAEQRAIGAVLDAIDDAIAQSERANAATEGLRRALLHELLTRGLPGWHTEWRDVSGLGAVPRCWTTVRLGDAYDIELGKMVSPPARSGPSKRLYLTNRNVRWGWFDLSDVSEMHFDPDELGRYRLRDGDLLVCEGGEVGRAAIWQDELADCYYQKALHRLRPRQVGQQPRFLRFLLEHTSGLGFLADKAPQTSIAHLTRETLLRTSLAFPDAPEQLAIAGAIETVEARIAADREALASLRALYARAADALLQGRLRAVSATPRQAADAK